MILKAPSKWPFPVSVVPASIMRSGRAYVIGPDGTANVDPVDVALLLGFGFTIPSAGGGTLPPGWAFVDNDGSLEIVTPDNTRIILVSKP